MFSPPAPRAWQGPPLSSVHPGRGVVTGQRLVAAPARACPLSPDRTAPGRDALGAYLHAPQLPVEGGVRGVSQGPSRCGVEHVAIEDTIGRLRRQLDELVVATARFQHV